MVPFLFKPALHADLSPMSGQMQELVPHVDLLLMPGQMRELVPHADLLTTFSKNWYQIELKSRD
jgi:hypothetical protein